MWYVEYYIGNNQKYIYLSERIIEMLNTLIIINQSYTAYPCMYIFPYNHNVM